MPDITTMIDTALGLLAERTTALFLDRPRENIPLPDPTERMPGSGHALNLTARELGDIELFLADATMISFVRIGIVAIATQNETDDQDLPADLKDDFMAATSEWCVRNGQTWNRACDYIWDTIAWSAATAFSQLATRLTPLALNELRDSTLFQRHSSYQTLRYVEIIRQLVREPPKLEAIASLTRQINSTDVDDTFPVQGEAAARFEDLYVERTLIDSETQSTVSVTNALQPNRGAYRHLIIGDPGAGKSTLTRWLTWNSRSDPSLPTPVVIVARTSLTSPDSTLFTALASSISMQLGRHCEPGEAEALLATGRVLPIIDGIDELQNRSRRLQVVAHLKATQAQFQAASFLCTTRRTGYEVAGLREAGFRAFNLMQYTAPQVREYAEKWFASIGAADRTERFLGESRDLNDLRSNPLMLSLLCNLYTHQDYIPQSRREVYQRCSELMFKEWDPRRGIDIPAIFKSRGTRALYAIAQYVSDRGGYGVELTASEITRTVFKVLVDSGVDDEEASTSSRELVDHCSTRAWILSQTSHSEGEGEALYSFTHRTFYEYFASEAIVQSVNNRLALGQKTQQRDSLPIGEMTRAVRDAYARDASSVMPELLLQATEATSRNGTAVIDDLIKLAKYVAPSSAPDEIALAVRLLAALGGDRAVAARVLDAVAALWREPRVTRRSDIYSLNTFRYLLDLPSAHRRVFRERVMADPLLKPVFANLWSRLAFLQETATHDSSWRDFAEQPELLAAGDDNFSEWARAQVSTSDLTNLVLRARGRKIFYLDLSGRSRKGLFWLWLASEYSTNSPRQKAKIQAHALKILTAMEFHTRHDLSLVPTSISASSTNALELRLCLALMVLSGEENDDILADLLDASHDRAACTLAGRTLRKIREDSLRGKASDLRSLESRARLAFQGVGFRQLPRESRTYLVLNSAREDAEEREDWS